MRPYIALKSLSSLALASASLLLGACGGSAPQQPVAAERSVFTSAADCADGGKLTTDQCATLIEQAVARHVAQAPTYSSLRSCEKAEGPDKCERTDAKSYRPRLIAYLVSIGQETTVDPLYPTSDGKPGFRLPNKKVLAADDDTITVSKSAVAAFERHLGAGNGDSGYNF